MMRLFGRSGAHQRAVVRQVAAWTLHYPDDDLRRRRGLLRESVAELGDIAPAADLNGMLTHLDRVSAREAEQHYVDVFDTSPRRGLHLTWYLHGDTRLRGSALAELMGVYRRHGFRLNGGELPDYLPALLEFTATSGPEATREGERLLRRFRQALRKLHDALAEAGTPYAGAVRAVLWSVPAGKEAAVPERPPVEHVGLGEYSLQSGQEARS